MIVRGRGITITRPFLFVLLTFLLTTFARADEYDTLRLKWFINLVGSGYNTADPLVADKLASIASTAQANWNSMDKSASRTYLWSNLADQSLSPNITNGYRNLFSMALAYATPGCSLAGNTALLNDTINGLDWMHANSYNASRPKVGNWFDWEIAAPTELLNTVVLLYDHLNSVQIQNYASAVEKWTPSGTVYTGANRAVKLSVVAIRGIIVKDSAKLVNARDACSQVFEYVTTGDGFYEDGSFIQHVDHPYTAGYGAGLLKALVPIYSLLSGSTWEIQDPKANNMLRWIYESFEPIIYRGAAWDMVRGRIVTGSGAGAYYDGHGIMDSIILLSEFSTPADAMRMKSMVKEWILASSGLSFISNRRELPVLSLAQAIMNDPNVPRRGELTGHYSFPGMARVMHLRKDYGFGLSMCSSRVNRFESFDGRNLNGWFTGDGMTMLYNGDYDAFTGNYQATVDAYRRPGVTADVTLSKTPHLFVPSGTTSFDYKAQGQGLSSYSWVGGAKLGDYGAAGMQFNGQNVALTGKKSWFMFDDEVVCLGAGITSTDNRPIETTVENRKLTPAGNNTFTVNGTAKPSTLGWAETMNGVNWAHLSGNIASTGIGYYFPLAASLATVREARTGSFAEVDSRGSSTPVTDNYLRMGFQHGNNPTNATYQYVLLPGRTAARVGEYAANPHVTILNNNADVQAVREARLGITAANFWTNTTKSIGGITANKMCSVVVRDDGTYIDVAVSDPTHENTGSISLQIASSATALVSADPEISVTQTDPGISMTVDVNGAIGKTFRARFYLGNLSTAETITVNPVGDTYVWDGGVTSNYGTNGSLVVKKASSGFNRESYLRFNVPTLNGALLGTSLKLIPVNSATPGVHGVSVVSDNTWIESGAGGLTWNNRPVSSGTLLSTWTPELNVPLSTDVSGAITGSGPVSFHIRAVTETSNGIVYYGSRENTTAANRPSLELLIGKTPPEVAITYPTDGDVLTNGGAITITASAIPTSNAVASVKFYDGTTLLGTDTSAPYSLTTTLPGGLRTLKAVATDTNSLSKTSLPSDVEVAHLPLASAGNVQTARNMAVDVDLRTIASDVETPDANLLFTLGAATNGSVSLLADGYTARFTPSGGYTGPASFSYTVTDATADRQTLFNYDFQSSDLSDATHRGRDGSLRLVGAGSADYIADFPAALGPHHIQSLSLTETGTAGAARVERAISVEDLNLVTDDWTIAGWFNRQPGSDMDLILQIGDSAGFGASALSLGFYSSSDLLQLRNYNKSNTQDISIDQAGISAGTWHHYAVVRAGNVMRLFLNGVLVGDDTSFSLDYSASTSIKFGGPESTSTNVLPRWFKGSLADIAVFEGALASAGISKIATLPVAYFSGLTSTNSVSVNVTQPPVASAGSVDTLSGSSVNIDLRSLASDAETPDSALHFTLGAATNGTVTLLSDGYTVRFTPAAGYDGMASFSYTVTDLARDNRTMFNYDFQASDVTDASGAGRDGKLTVLGSGTGTFISDIPAAFAPYHTRTLRLTENGTAGAARVERGLANDGLNVLTDNWTVSGWFNRQPGSDMDILLQIGDSAGFGTNALSLGFYNSSDLLQLRNYNGSNTLDIDISQANMVAGSWHHYAVVREGNVMRLYLNGALTGSDNSFSLSYAAETAIKFGGTSNTSSSVLPRWFNGSLADLSVFKGALNTAEVSRLSAIPTAYFASQSATNSVSVDVARLPIAPTPTDGLLAEFFDYTTALSALPDLTGRTPDVVRLDSGINYPSVSGVPWPGLPSAMIDTFASRHTGSIFIETAGNYTFFLQSDDGSKMWLDGEEFISNDGVHGMIEKSSTKFLTSGYHDIRVEFFENGGGAGLIWMWQGPGLSKQPVPSAVLYMNSPSDYQPGLWYGTVAGNINTTAPNPNLSVTTNLNEVRDAIAGNTTEIYTGRIFDADGLISFFENIDDKVRLYIGGQLVLNNDGWNVPTKAVGLNLAPGWHDFELRISNGTGGSGPLSHPGFTSGFGYDPNGGENWIFPQDPGNGSLFSCLVTGEGFLPTTNTPNVVGLNQSAAVSSITAAGLAVGSVTTSYSNSVPIGEVLNQNPVGGSLVTSGSNVNIVVSIGPDATPKLVRTKVSAVGTAGWTTVSLGQNYNSLVVIATPIYPTSALPPVVTRIANVTSSGFDLKIQRVDGQTGLVSLDVHILAVEEGVYTQATDGVKMEAMKFNSTVTASNTSWVAVARPYQNTYTNPVVVGQVMSSNDTRWSVFWSMGSSQTNPVDASNLNLGKHVGEDPDKLRTNETIGYIVIEQGTGIVNGVAYEAALGAATIRGFGQSPNPFTYPLSGTLPSVGGVAASISGMAGQDGAWAVLSGNPSVTTTSIGLHACEDQLFDTEQGHALERVGYIVFE